MTTGKMKLTAMPRYFPRPTCLMSWLSEVSLHGGILKLQPKGKTLQIQSRGYERFLMNILSYAQPVCVFIVSQKKMLLESHILTTALKKRVRL